MASVTDPKPAAAGNENIQGKPGKAAPASKSGSTTPQRKIPGNLPYLTSSGTLKKVLDRLIEASRPDKFNADYLENVLKLTGGAARATIPILKKMEFLSSDGVPTERYGRFRTDSGRALAALQGLRSAFAEIFKRSEYAHQATDTKLKDIIVEITGLIANDPIAQAIKGTFGVIKSYVPANFDASTSAPEEFGGLDEAGIGGSAGGTDEGGSRDLGLIYNINIVLPETSDLKVLNAIFRSLKENLMR